MPRRRRRLSSEQQFMLRLRADQAGRHGINAAKLDDFALRLSHFDETDMKDPAKIAAYLRDLYRLGQSDGVELGNAEPAAIWRQLGSVQADALAGGRVFGLPVYGAGLFGQLSEKSIIELAMNDPVRASRYAAFPPAFRDLGSQINMIKNGKGDRHPPAALVNSFKVGVDPVVDIASPEQDADRTIQYLRQGHATDDTARLARGLRGTAAVHAMVTSIGAEDLDQSVGSLTLEHLAAALYLPDLTTPATKATAAQTAMIVDDPRADGEFAAWVGRQLQNGAVRADIAYLVGDPNHPDTVELAFPKGVKVVRAEGQPLAEVAAAARAELGLAPAKAKPQRRPSWLGWRPGRGQGPLAS